MTFTEWLKEGIDRGWIGPPVCLIHDGTPTSEDEDHAWDEGGDDFCLSVIRVYDDTTHKKDVEKNHSPSVWRKTNLFGGKSE